MIDLHGIPQVLWPIHCVQETEGAQFISNLDQSKVTRVFRKGQNPSIDSYSGFLDNDHQSSTGMGEYLREQGVDEVFVVGLATDYCVRFTAADAAEFGLRTIVISDATRGVNLQKGDRPYPCSFAGAGSPNPSECGVTLILHKDLNSSQKC